MGILDFLKVKSEKGETPKHITDEVSGASRMMGAAAKHDKTLIDTWKTRLKAAGINPTQRIIEIAMYDLQEGNQAVNAQNLQQVQSFSNDDLPQIMQLSNLLKTQIVSDSKYMAEQHQQNMNQLNSLMIQTFQSIKQLQNSMPQIPKKE